MALQYAANTRYCGTLMITGKAFYASPVSFVLPRNSPFTEPMDVATLELRNYDAIPSLESYIDVKGRCTNRHSTNLSFKKLQVFFYFAFGSCFLIFLEMTFYPQEPLKEKRTHDEKKGASSDIGESKV